MNKLKTIGISALAGSLVALSAQAGDLTVTGSANISYVDKEANQANSNPIGISNALTFNKSGELDNGWTWAGAVIYLGGSDVIGAISTSHITFTMGDMGSLMIGNNAEAIGSIDDVMPTAYEESWNGLDSGPALVGMGAGNMVTYTTPDLGSGTTLVFTWDAAAGGGTASTEGGVTTAGGDSVLEMAFKNTGLIEGLTIGGGVAEENRSTAPSQIGAYSDKPWEATAYAKYAIGGITIGYQEAAEDPGKSDIGGAQEYESSNLAISFQVNDDLTVSYSDFESVKSLNNDNADIVMDIDSINVSYSMGAMSVRIQDSDASNANYTTGTDEEHTEINVSLSF